MKNLSRPPLPLRLSGRFFDAGVERWRLIEGGGIPADHAENQVRALAGQSGQKGEQVGRTLDRMIDEVESSVAESDGSGSLSHDIVRAFQFQRARSGCATIAIVADAIPDRGMSLYWHVAVFALDKPRNKSFARISDEYTEIDPDAYGLLRLGRTFTGYSDVLGYISELDLLLARHAARQPKR